MAEALANPKQIRPTLERFCVDLRRWLKKERLQISRQPFELTVHPHERVCVSRRILSKFSLGTFALCPPGHNVSIREGNLDHRIARNHTQSVSSQVKVT